MKNVRISDILPALKADGWVNVVTKGSHRQFKHPVKKGKVTVNGHPSGSIFGPLLRSIEAQSGLKF